MKIRTFTVFAILSLAIFIAVVYLWYASPDQFYFVSTQRHQFSFDATQGRFRLIIIDLVWPPPTTPNTASTTGFRTLINIPLWPIALAGAVLPVL